MVFNLSGLFLWVFSPSALVLDIRNDKYDKIFTVSTSNMYTHANVSYHSDLVIFWVTVINLDSYVGKPQGCVMPAYHGRS